MSNLTLKYIQADTDISLFDFNPSPEDGYTLNIDFGIGDKDKNGSEAFSLTIGDEKGLLKLMWNDTEFKANQITSLSHYHLILMNPYRYESLLIYLQGIIEKIPDNYTWQQQGLLLSHYFYWEQREETIESLSE